MSCHSFLRDKKQESKVDCLFGEHFLSKYPQNTSALAEV